MLGLKVRATMPGIEFTFLCDHVLRLHLVHVPLGLSGKNRESNASLFIAGYWPLVFTAVSTADTKTQMSLVTLLQLTFPFLYCYRSHKGMASSGRRVLRAYLTVPLSLLSLHFPSAHNL